MHDPSPSNADSLKLQLLTARTNEWWPATADSLPEGGYLLTVMHTTLAGIEPTTFRLLVRCATNRATDCTKVVKDDEMCHIEQKKEGKP